MSIENSKIVTTPEMQHKMELEGHVMEYAQKEKGINLVDWAMKYSVAFRELFENSDIWERYKKVHDSNPEDLYKWIQNSVEEMTKVGR